MLLVPHWGMSARAHALMPQWVLPHWDLVCHHLYGLLDSCPKYLTDKLQTVLRAAARLILQLLYRSSVTDIASADPRHVTSGVLLNALLHYITSCTGSCSGLTFKVGWDSRSACSSTSVSKQYLTDYCISVALSSTRQTLRSARLHAGASPKGGATRCLSEARLTSIGWFIW